MTILEINNQTLEKIVERPVLPVRVIINRDDTVTLLIEKCPFCGKKHTHGYDVKPLRNGKNRLQYRQSHCDKYDGTYAILLPAFIPGIDFKD